MVKPFLLCASFGGCFTSFFYFEFILHFRSEAEFKESEQRLDAVQKAVSSTWNYNQCFEIWAGAQLENRSENN